jgi:hypothetical protein
MRHLSRRHRVRLIWLSLAALLLQQVALAAHACDLGFALSEASSPASSLCEHRDDAVTADVDSVDAHAVDVLCLKHCAPDRAAQADQVSAKLALLLPPVALPVMAMRQPPAMMRLQPTLPGGTPPLTLQFCTLLI